MAAAGSSLRVVWWRPRSARRAAIAGVAAIVLGAAVAGALASQSGSLRSAEAASVSIHARDVRGVESVGAGVVLSSSGTVLTANSSVEGADTISVFVPGRSTAVPASVVGIDPSDGVAVIQLQGVSGLPVVQIGDPTRVAVGDHVSAIAPGTGGVVVVQGTVVSLGNAVMRLSPAMSNLEPGEPVVDSGGSVVAVSVAGTILGPAGSAGSALLITNAITVAHDIASGRPNAGVLRGGGSVLGVGVRDSATPPGALVVSVAAASPARAVGIQPGDVIEQIGTVHVLNAVAAPDALRGHKAGDRVRIQWVTSAGREMSATVTIAAGTTR
ncbi:MAG: S1C family serine protease [Candidatus Dormibacteria bacterium]